MNDESKRRIGEMNDVHEAADGIVAHPRVKRRRDGHLRAGRQKQRMTVGRAARAFLCRNESAGSRTVVDDDVLAERLRHGRRDEPRGNVLRTARRERHQQADGLRELHRSRSGLRGSLFRRLGRGGAKPDANREQHGEDQGSRVGSPKTGRDSAFHGGNTKRSRAGH
jgi:hypothetical protein